MNLFQHIARAAAELLTLPDPYPDKYFSPEITGTYKDKCGRTVLEVKAMNYQDAARFTDVTTPTGNVSRTITHVGRNTWEIGVEDWDT